MAVTIECKCKGSKFYYARLTAADFPNGLELACCKERMAEIAAKKIPEEVAVLEPEKVEVFKPHKRGRPKKLKE